MSFDASWGWGSFTIKTIIKTKLARYDSCKSGSVCSQTNFLRLRYLGMGKEKRQKGKR